VPSCYVAGSRLRPRKRLCRVAETDADIHRTRRSPGGRPAPVYLSAADSLVLVASSSVMGMVSTSALFFLLRFRIGSPSGLLTEAERPRRIHPGQSGYQAGIVAHSARTSGSGLCGRYLDRHAGYSGVPALGQTVNKTSAAPGADEVLVARRAGGRA